MGKLPGHMKRFRGWHKQQQHEIAEHADTLRRLEVHAAAPRVVSTQLSPRGVGVEGARLLPPHKSITRN